MSPFKAQTKGMVMRSMTARVSGRTPRHHTKASAACSTAAVNQGSGLGEIKLCRTFCGVVGDLVEYWGRRPVNF